MSDNDIKTMAVMIANRAADIEATEQTKERRDNSKLAFKAFCEGLCGRERERIEKHHPELFAEGSNINDEEC